MNARSAAIQGLLALAALVLAYATWQKRPEAEAQEVVVLDAKRAEIGKVRFEDGTRWTEVFRASEGGEAVPWVRYGEKPAPAKPEQPDGGALTAAPARPTVPDREVKGNEQAERLLEKFAPLRATRSLGVLSPEKRKELGLDNTSRRLEVTVRGMPHVFAVSTGGLGNPYLLDESDGHVYLEPGALLMDLDAASSRLIERRLHGFNPSEVDGVKVIAGGKQRALVQTATQFGQITKVAPASTPDKPDELARNWLEKVWRLLPAEVLGKGESPPGGSPQIDARVEYSSRGKPAGFAELAHSGADTYVRTENLSGWAKVRAPDQLLAEAKRVAEGS